MKRLLVIVCVLGFSAVLEAQPRARCAASLLPQFETPQLELSFQVPDIKEKEPWQFKPKSQSCSGVDCGCDIEMQECSAGCDPNSENYGQCAGQCAHAYMRCARCCCCEEFCPTYCY